jgi:hypothetical protein
MIGRVISKGEFCRSIGFIRVLTEVSKMILDGDSRDAVPVRYILLAWELLWLLKGEFNVASATMVAAWCSSE